MPREKDWTPVKVPAAKALDETPNGALVVLVGRGRVFIPKSLIDDDSEVWEVGQEGELVIPTWLANEKGLKGEAKDDDDDEVPDLVDMIEGRDRRRR